MKDILEIIKEDNRKNQYYKYQNNINLEIQENIVNYKQHFDKEKFIEHHLDKTSIINSKKLQNKLFAFDLIFNYLNQFKFINSNFNMIFILKQRLYKRTIKVPFQFFKD